MDENRVLLTIIPSGGDDSAIDLSDFLKQVDALRKLVFLAPRYGEIDARIVGLSMNSPASIEFEVISHQSRDKFNVAGFFHDIYNVVEKSATPLSFSRDVFDAVKDFASVVGRGVNRAIIKTAGDEISVDVHARARIDEVFGQDYSREGTADGMLEAVNIHGKVNNCALYPIVGPNRITCKFDEKLFKQVRPALGKYVLIEGDLKYRWREKFPHEATIKKLEVLPGWENQPSFEDIIGLAPAATDGISSEDFTAGVRHGW